MKVSINGELIDYFYENNNRPLVLMIHGFNSNKKNMYKNLLHLDRCYDIVALDLPGHGLSTSFNVTIPAYYKIVKSFIKMLDVDELVVVGHSMGGPVALSSSRMNCVKKTLLLAPLNHQIKVINLKKQGSPSFTSVVNTITNAITNNSKININSNRMELFRCELTNENFLKKYVKPIYKKGKNYSIIGGGKDFVVDLNSLQKIARQYKVNLQIMQNTGHSILKDSPNEINNILNQLVKEFKIK